MGDPGQGGELRTFYGISEGTDEDPAKLSEALRSAAAAAIEAGIVSRDQSAWFTITSLDVELANQHARTFRVGVTQK